MRSGLRHAALASIIGLANLASPAEANTIGVSTCSSAGSSGAPTLHIVDGASRYSIPVGQNGLTSTIIFNKARAFAWLVSSGLFPDGTNFGNYDNFTCGIQTEEATIVIEERQPTPPAVVPLEVEEVEEEAG